MKLTPKQQEIYDLIKGHIKNEGYAPSTKELCVLLGIKSTSTVHGRLKILEMKGLIKIIPNTSRGIVLLEESEVEEVSNTFEYGRVNLKNLFVTNDKAIYDEKRREENVIVFDSDQVPDFPNGVYVIGFIDK